MPPNQTMREVSLTQDNAWERGAPPLDETHEGSGRLVGPEESAFAIELKAPREGDEKKFLASELLLDTGQEFPRDGVIAVDARRDEVVSRGVSRDILTHAGPVQVMGPDWSEEAFGQRIHTRSELCAAAIIEIGQPCERNLGSLRGNTSAQEISEDGASIPAPVIGNSRTTALEHCRELSDDDVVELTFLANSRSFAHTLHVSPTHALPLTDDLPGRVRVGGQAARRLYPWKVVSRVK